MLATLRDYGPTYGRVPILCDSSSAISVAKNPMLHSRTKHIDVRYHFLRDNYENGIIDIVKVASENQVADILTKPLDLETFNRLRGELGDVWIMDSGCSRHMTGHRKWFSNLNPVSTKEYITFGDNGQGKVMGVGSVSLSAKLSLREVAFVRNLGFNLVSVSQLLDEGFEVRFKKGACCVLDAEETLVCSLLPFGQSLSSMGLIRGLPKLRAEKDLVCHPRRHGKMVAASHIPVSRVMTSYPGELLHMDTVGPARVASIGGKWYVLVVVDDFSRFSWVFFMEFKDEAFGFVRDLVPRLRNESHKAMRAIRGDNGGEFETLNGVVERKNRTLVEMARTMLDEHRTPRRFWAEAVNTAVTLQTESSCELSLGRPRMNFGLVSSPASSICERLAAVCFVLKKAGHLDKFESRCLDGIFKGYASNSRGFRVWILEAKQVVETCEVSFDETMPRTTPAFELSGDDEEGTSIFEDEEGVVNDGDAGATAPAAAPTPLATSSMMKEDPCPHAFFLTPPTRSSSAGRTRRGRRGGDFRDCSISASPAGSPSTRDDWRHSPACHTLFG
ncbi:hypothetical protein U9M48_035729 [Paspalum notatum var. saurae]|uniref:Integrase catalytic domain-containing protein n=1 Tax=Paspalum notatum var. saurae TaxID=547442 RepID=A0AAQ3XAA8_PASNO